MHDSIEFDCGGGVVALIHLSLPQNHGGVIAVAMNHVARILVGALVKQLIAHELPAGIGDNRQDSKFIACIHKRRVLRIVAAVRGEARVAELLHVLVVGRGGEGVSDIGVILMAIGPDGEEVLAVDRKTVLAIESESLDADAGVLIVHDLPVQKHRGVEDIEVRMLRVPEHRVRQVDLLSEGLIGSWRQGRGRFVDRGQRSIGRV